MNDALVSIIIPTFNRAEVILETLDSVKAQTYSNWECIIVDDGSLDNTSNQVAHYCSSDARFQLFQRPSERLKGANSCRNIGFEVSRGEYIQFLDSDDLIEENSLAERVAILNFDPSIDLLIRDTGLLIDSVRLWDSINNDPKERTSENYLRMFLRYDIPWPIMSALYKRKLLEECMFDEGLQRFQDVSFNIKILSLNKELKLFRDKKVDSFYRVDKEKGMSQAFLHKVLKALIYFNEIHAELNKVTIYKSDLKKFNIIIFNHYFLNGITENRREVWRLVFSYMRGNKFSLKEKLYLFLCYFFNSTGIIHKRGIGMFRFHKSYQKIFKL